jgi:UDP-N-acetylmuramate dehydrogenase
MNEFTERRHQTQPPGASMGSMFKNPAGDAAGRLVDVAGLKGTRIGDAQISTLHGNFFINHGQATAADIYQLIDLARSQVAQKLGVNLELEIECLGDW